MFSCPRSLNKAMYEKQLAIKKLTSTFKTINHQNNEFKFKTPEASGGFKDL